MPKQKFGFQVFGSLLLFCAAVTSTANGHDGLARIEISQDDTFMEVVGQNNIFETTPQQSKQVGYLSRLAGIESIFNGTTMDETTADFTFLNDVLRTQVNASGPMRMVQRDGTFTLYRNFASADFADLGSFSSGTLILTGSSHQQVVLDTTSGTFSVYTDITVTSSSTFSLNGTTYRLGKAGDTFRIFFYGHSADTDIPAAWFGGYAVGTGK